MGAEQMKEMERDEDGRVYMGIYRGGNALGLGVDKGKVREGDHEEGEG